MPHTKRLDERDVGTRSFQGWVSKTIGHGSSEVEGDLPDADCISSPDRCTDKT